MKLGFFTACLPHRSLSELVTWAHHEGFDALEVAAWPEAGERAFTASHIPVATLGESAADEIGTLLDEHGLTLSSIGFYGNNLHPDRGERDRVVDHLRSCIRSASLLRCPTVGTFIGRDPTKTVADNLKEAEALFTPLVEEAGELGVRLVIENCVMEGWHPDGYPGNLAYSPELWEWMFDLGLYLNYDPSHLVWMGIDPVEALRPYAERVLHVQAKDVEVFPSRRSRYGWPGIAVRREEDPWNTGWWRYRVPGRGQVDWSSIIDTLYEAGFDGAVSVEHEDPVWGGSDERIEMGLQISYRTLRPLIVH